MERDRNNSKAGREGPELGMPRHCNLSRLAERGSFFGRDAWWIRREATEPTKGGACCQREEEESEQD